MTVKQEGLFLRRFQGVLVLWSMRFQLRSFGTLVYEILTMNGNSHQRSQTGEKERAKEATVNKWSTIMSEWNERD